MAHLLKQSTAFTFRLGPFLDDTDGKTAKTALSLVQADYRLSKAGGAFAQKADTSAGAHDENGYYTCILNSTDTGTLGTFDINVSKTSALPVFKSFMIVPANIYDSVVTGSDLLDVSVTQVNGSAINNLVSGRVDASIGAVATGAIAAASFAANALDAVWSTAARVLTAGTNIALAKGTGVTGFNDPTSDANADALLDRAAGVETGWTFRQAMRIVLAVLAGKASGMATTTAVFRDMADSKNRISATVDASGNRSAVTRDAT